ncbi:hypothetical protein JOC34_000599 [Virgibacillus halotolerans]|uniref:hypothetical protein n=1 Tax=Virgibacillus halotolerans TaxID=1071053 RepID=UPI001962255D|nr:hypothetical protein [Virgibacillus halotolerans]MBM7598242.1 hypothetical protein [Virgibacillus halotolerans]
MKILTDYDQLVGKTIAFAHMAQFADQITLATTDNEVLMADMESVDESLHDKEITVYSEGMVMNRLNYEPYLRKKLSEIGVFDLEAYKEERQKQMEEAKRKREEQKKINEIKEFERLKKKFEG